MTAWHYTISDRAWSIFSDGLIKPATAGVYHPEKPVVWFSTQQHWEPTANKVAVLRGGSMVHMTTKQMFDELAGELFRFGIGTHHLLPWHRLARAARIPIKVQKGLIKAARAVRADPIKWYGTLEPVPVTDTIIQRFNPIKNEWVAAAANSKENEDADQTG